MAEFIVTDPSGKEHVVTAPDGATQEQALAFAKSKFAATQEKPNPLGALVTKALPYARGIIGGGPLGLAIAGFGEAQKGLGEAGRIAGGFATDTLATHVPPEVAGAVGAATEIAVPAAIGGFIGKAVGTPAIQATGKSLMQSALKPSSTELASGDAAKAIQTMLNEGGGAIIGKGTNVTPAGAAALRAKISELHAEVAKKIATSQDMVDKSYVATEVAKTLTKFRQQVVPGADTKAVLSAWDEFNRRFGEQIPISQAQALKTGTQQIISKKYGELSGASVEAEKSMARGLRLGIEAKIPEVGKLNAKESELLNALYIADKRAGLEGNKNPLSFALLAHNPEAAAAFMVDRSSLFKSILSRLMYSNAGTASAGAGAVIGGTAGTVADTVNKQIQTR